MSKRAGSPTLPVLLLLSLPLVWLQCDYDCYYCYYYCYCCCYYYYYYWFRLERELLRSALLCEG